MVPVGAQVVAEVGRIIRLPLLAVQAGLEG